MATVSLSLGASALALMGSAALLGGRWKLVESWFGGLERVYQTHEWLGMWALVWSRCSISSRPAGSSRAPTY